MICDNLTISPSGHLLFAGQDTVELAKQYGTPLYLMDEDRIRHNCRVYTQAFRKHFGPGADLDPRGEVITVDFDGRMVEYGPEMLGELEPAYAMTVHKAQGSEYRAVILAVSDGSPMLLSRGVLYTAITRARELFILVGDDEKVAQMVRNDRQQRRYSGLRARLARGS